MINLIIPVFLLITSPQGTDKDFEGSLQVVKTTLYDTSIILYKIKNYYIKIEEYDQHANLLLTYLVDFDKNIIYAIDPLNKRYKPLDIRPFSPSNSKNFEVIKSENFMYLNGYKCTQWRIKNRDDNTEIAYWVTKDEFNFYEKMLRTINSFEKPYNYFLHIPDNQGYIPMLAVERTLLRDEKSRIEIVRIEKEFLDKNIFEIPENYKLFN